jgi:ABC-type transport system substrate-binding protein
MEYRKHPNYWGGDPFIDRWHASIVPEYSNRYAQFITGNIMDFTPTARDVLLLAKDAPGAVIVANEIPNNNATRMRFGRIDPDKQLWADPRVRVAIRRSIDFKSIGDFQSNKAEFEGAGIPVEVTPMTHLPQNPAYWLNPEKGELGKVSENYLYDPAAARALISAAGLTTPVPILYPISLGDSGGQVSPRDELVMNSFAATGTFKLEVERVGSRLEYNRYTIEGLHSGFLGTQSGSSDDADYFVFRDYHSGGRPDSQAYPHAKIDELGDAQRRELDVGKRAEILKEFQLFLADWMATVPGTHLFTSFSFRWPWLRNFNWGEGGSPPTGRPSLGGHLHWLVPEMPNRDRVI